MGSEELYLSLRMLLLLVAGTGAYAAPVLVPSDLRPGDTYRIVFVTPGMTGATSSDIDFYNSFVTNEAEVSALAALGTTWRALGTTEFVHAIDNAGLDPADTTTRFYNTLGELLAVGVLGDGNTLYSAFTPHLAAIYNPDGVGYLGREAVVWTGTLAYGEVSDFALGLRSAIIGFSDSEMYWAASDTSRTSRAARMYGISGVLTVSADTPEPGTLGGVLVGLGWCAVRLRSASGATGTRRG